MAPKPKKKTARGKAVEDAHQYDDKITRRLPTKDLSITLKPNAQMPLGVVLGTHPLGAIVRELHENGRALEAGLKHGDVLVTINGEAVSGHHQAAALILAASAARADEPRIVVGPSTDGSPPAAENAIQLSYYEAASAEGLMLKKRSLPKLMAIDLQKETEGMNAQKKGFAFGAALLPHPLGVSCETVEKGSLAQKVGLKAGDVLVTIAGRAILDVKEATSILNASASEGRVTLPAAGAGSNWWQGGNGKQADHLAGPLRLSYYPVKAAAVELVLLNSSFLGSAADDERVQTTRGSAQPGGSNALQASRAAVGAAAGGGGGGAFPPRDGGGGRTVAFGQADSPEHVTLDGVSSQPISPSDSFHKSPQAASGAEQGRPDNAISPALRRARNSRSGSLDKGATASTAASKRPGGGTGFSLTELEEAEQRDVESLEQIASLAK